MSALDDIRDTLRAAPPVQHDWGRVIFVGDSARRAINAWVAVGEASDADMDEIEGVMVRDTTEFQGWAIRDVDPEGRWHDIDFL